MISYSLLKKQGDTWFETATDQALWGNTQNEQSKAVPIDRGVKVFYNRCAHYPASARDSGKTRVLTNKQLTCMLPSGQVVDRQWIMYSLSRRNIYCFACKLFSTKSQAFVTGYCAWKQPERIGEHERNVCTCSLHDCSAS